MEGFPLLTIWLLLLQANALNRNSHEESLRKHLTARGN